VRVFARPDPLLSGHYGNYSPEHTPLYIPRFRPASAISQGCYTHNPTNGDDVAFIWRDGEKQAALRRRCGQTRIRGPFCVPLNF